MGTIPSQLLLVSLLTLCFLPSYAYGYVDPSWSYVIGQILVAVAVASILFVRKIWRRLRALRRRSALEAPVQPEGDAPQKKQSV